MPKTAASRPPQREVARLLVTPQYPLGLCPVHIGIGAKCDAECLPNRLAWPPLVEGMDHYFARLWRGRRAA